MIYLSSSYIPKMTHLFYFDTKIVLSVIHMIVEYLWW